jgi:uncharacterized protein YcbK (DUF882 family)
MAINEFQIKGFKGLVDMRQPVIPGGNFTWGEFLHWDDFAYRDIRLPREAQHAYNLVNLAKSIQPVREHIGKPMKVTSGYRPDPYNRRAGGASNSMHKFGKAGDFHIPGVNHYQLARELFYDYGFQGGVGGYPSWIHLDIGARRKWGF